MDFDPKEAEMKYCGIDLHSNNSVVVVSDAEDRIVFNKRLPTIWGKFVRRSSRIRKSWRVWLSRAPTTGTGWWTG